MPYQLDNRDFLRDAGPGTRPEWDSTQRLWTVSRAALSSVIEQLLTVYPVVEVITDGSTANRCDTRCREATGSECVCQCAGSMHGSKWIAPNERIVGETTVVGGVSRWRRVIHRHS